MTKAEWHEHRASFDHLYPRAGTGQHVKARPGRGAMTHAACNLKKGERQPYPCEVLAVEAITLLYEAAREQDIARNRSA